MRGQELVKQQRYAAERQQDRRYAALESAQQEKAEYGRQRFFDHMKSFQDANDAKTQQLSNFLTGKDLASLSKLDEARYMQAVQDRESDQRKRDE